VVLSLFDDTPAEPLSPGFGKTLLFGSIKAKDVPLPDAATGMDLAKLAARYSDGIIMGGPGVQPELRQFAEASGHPVLPFDQASQEDGSYMDRYNAFYEDLIR
jgi:starch synthase